MSIRDLIKRRSAPTPAPVEREQVKSLLIIIKNIIDSIIGRNLPRLESAAGFAKSFLGKMGISKLWLDSAEISLDRMVRAAKDGDWDAALSYFGKAIASAGLGVV